MPQLRYFSENDTIESVTLGADPLTFGTEQEAGLVLREGGLAPIRGKIWCEEGRWFIAVHSDSGDIKVNDAAVSSSALTHNDTITMGNSLFHFLDHPRAPDPLPASHGEEEPATPCSELWIRSPFIWSLLGKLSSQGGVSISRGEVLQLFKEAVALIYVPDAVLISIDQESTCWTAPRGVVDPEAFCSEMLVDVFPEMSRQRGLIEGARQTAAGEVRTYLGVPLLLEGEIHGFLYLERNHAAGFSKYERQMLHFIERLMVATIAGSDRFARLHVGDHGPGDHELAVSGIIGESGATRELRRIITRTVGPVGVTVLLLGDTGTGKTLVAEAIHNASARCGQPFVKINCAAIPRTLLESELFGYEKGAFTGAESRKKGLFEMANHGTLFLDEIGELDLGSQAKLLAVLQDRKLQRIAGQETIDLDVRILAATNKDLQEEVNCGRFRSDLFYRLNVVTLTLTPLGVRREDIIPLTMHFIRRFNEEMDRSVQSIDEKVMEAFNRYDWPGNIRELSNTIEKAMIFAEGTKQLMLRDFPGHFSVRLENPRSQDVSPSREDPQLVQGELSEEQLVRSALAMANGNRRKAARILGWYPQKLYSRINRYSL